MYLIICQSTLEILKRQPGMSERNPSFSNQLLGFPGGSDGKESACNARHLGSIPGSGRSLEESMATHSHTLCLETPMDRGAWWAAVCGVTQSGHDWAANTFTFLPTLKQSCNYFLSVQHFLISKIGKTILNPSGYHTEFNNKGEEPQDAWQPEATIVTTTTLTLNSQQGTHDIKTAWTVVQPRSRRPAQIPSLPHIFPHIVSSNDKSVLPYSICECHIHIGMFKCYFLQGFPNWK